MEYKDAVLGDKVRGTKFMKAHLKQAIETNGGLIIISKDDDTQTIRCIYGAEKDRTDYENMGIIACRPKEITNIL